VIGVDNLYVRDEDAAAAAVAAVTVTLLKLGLGQLFSVQRVGVELAQSVELRLTDRADRVLIDSYRILWSCHSVVRKNFRGGSRALSKLVPHVRIAPAM